MTGARPQVLGRPVIQNCWVVPSIEEAVDHWVKMLGVGAWLLMDNDASVPRYYHGRPTECRYRAALAQWGPIQVELVDSLRDGESPFNDGTVPGQPSFHHVAIESPDYDADVAQFAKMGLPLAFESTFGEMRFGMIDARPVLGCMLELLEGGETLKQAFSLVESLSEGFDGSEPLRTPG